MKATEAAAGEKEKGEGRAGGWDGSPQVWQPLQHQ